MFFPFHHGLSHRFGDKSKAAVIPPLYDLVTDLLQTKMMLHFVFDFDHRIKFRWVMAP